MHDPDVICRPNRWLTHQEGLVVDLDVDVVTAVGAVDVVGRARKRRRNGQ